jgi:hypothetical protein
VELGREVFNDLIESMMRKPDERRREEFVYRGKELS